MTTYTERGSLVTALRIKLTEMFYVLGVQSEEQDPHTVPLLSRGDVEEESPVRPGEDRSSGFWLTVVWALWVSQWRRLVRHKISEHLALDRMSRYEIQLELCQLCCPFSDVNSCIRVMKHDPQWI
jgi:hypothetical protein